MDNNKYFNSKPTILIKIMKKITLVFALFLSSFAAFSQINLPCTLDKKEVNTRNDTVFLTTQCVASKTTAGWLDHIFTIASDFSPLMPQNKRAVLLINQSPYTGFLTFKKDTPDFTKELVYQYDTGRFERVDSFFTLKDKNTIQVTTKDAETNTIDRKPTHEMVAKKPVLYLYPTEKTDINVKLSFKNSQIIHPYPAYNEGWNVTATPDGNLINKQTGREHYCLFWESTGSNIIERFQTGFVVKGTETATFLEEKLHILGLSPKESNEFIIFWLPMMENNPYNVIYFAQSEYQNKTDVQITPKPDVLLRIMMVWQSANKNVTLPEQKLPQTPARKGFTAVEWGGQQLDNSL